jgi:hypothetical protein
MTACSTVAPRYTPLPEHINLLRDAKLEPTKVGEFAADPGSGDRVNQLSIRGGSYLSPYDGSWVSYLKEALRQELEDARLLSPNASLELTGVLIRNEVNAGGVTTANAQIEARFIVRREGQVRFSKVKSATYEWDSSFMGNIAIPRAQQNYPVVIQRLLSALYADPDFLAALKK